MWWGPGKPIDTERYFVISSNMLGSSYGTTAPRSIDPRTGKPYGPHFPPITLKDIVTVQRRLLDKLGINRLLAVVGPSYGGMQAFSWATEFPDFMKGTVAVVTSLGPTPRSILERITSMLRADPNWNGGDYYATGGVVDTLTHLRENTLKSYGIEEDLKKAFPERGIARCRGSQNGPHMGRRFRRQLSSCTRRGHDALRPAAETCIA